MHKGLHRLTHALKFVGLLAAIVLYPLMFACSEPWQKACVCTCAHIAVFAGTLAVSVSFPFIFLDCFACVRDNDMWGHLSYYAPFIAIFQFGWASTQIAHMSLMSQLTQDKSHQTELSGLRSVDHRHYRRLLCSWNVDKNVYWKLRLWILAI